MLIGYNNDVQHRGKTFHIQTEDRGMSSKQIETQIFHAGAILDTRIVSYEDLLDASDKAKQNKSIKGLMQTTHKELFRNLMSGQYDHSVGLEAAPSEAVPAAAEPESFEPGQDRVPEAARRIEAGESVDIDSITGEQGDQHVDLAKLQEQLAEVGDEDSDGAPTQITSLDAIPDLLQAPLAPKSNIRQTGARKAPNFNIRSLGKPNLKESLKRAASKETFALPTSGNLAWQGCQPPTEDLSIAELVEAFLKT